MISTARKKGDHPKTISPFMLFSTQIRDFAASYTASAVMPNSL